MKIKKKLIFILPVLLVVTAIFAYQYINQSHRNIAEEQVEFQLSTIQLKEAFESVDDSQKYVDKVIQVEGVITESESMSIVLEDRIQVDFLNVDQNAINSNESIVIKGRCVGYDDILELVKVDQASIVKEK